MIVGYMVIKVVLINVVEKLYLLGFCIGFYNLEYDFNECIYGCRVMDYIIDLVDGICIYVEFDIYWICVVGYDEIEFIKCYSGCVLIVYMKDFLSGFELEDMDNNLVEIG